MKKTHRSDSFCNDVVALICKELNFLPQVRDVPTTKVNAEMVDFAFSESKAKLPSLFAEVASFFSRNRIRIATILLFIFGIPIAALGILYPSQVTFGPVGYVMTVASFLLELSNRLRKKE